MKIFAASAREWAAYRKQGPIKQPASKVKSSRGPWTTSKNSSGKIKVFRAIAGEQQSARIEIGWEFESGKMNAQDKFNLGQAVQDLNARPLDISQQTHAFEVLQDLCTRQI